MKFQPYMYLYLCIFPYFLLWLEIKTDLLWIRNFKNHNAIVFEVNFIQILLPGDELLVWYGKEYAAELGILFEEEDEVATVPTNQPEPSYDDIEEISLEEVDRILQQKAASSGSSNNAVLDQPAVQPPATKNPYLITAEMARRFVGADIDHSSAAACAKRNAAAVNESQTYRRQPKAKRGVPQEGLTTIDPSKYAIFWSEYKHAT